MTTNNSRKAKDTDSKIVCGSARFTIITPNLIRMEYTKCQGFIDAETLFARCRNTRYTGAMIIKTKNSVTIDTGALKLKYNEDGKPFHKGNLIVKFSGKTWQPGLKNKQNLGGPIATLDNVNGPVPLSDGLLSKDGWFLLDDSGRPLLKNSWIEQRPGGISEKERFGPESVVAKDEIDWYLFVYGIDFAKAFESLAAISGKVPMPRKHVFGSWYCRWFKYTSKHFREIVSGYRKHDFPLDILVMDMDWHELETAKTGYGHATQLGWTGYTWNRDLLPDAENLLKELKNDGIYVTLNDHPADGVRDHEFSYKSFMRKLKRTPGENIPYNAGDRKYMEAVFETTLRPLEKQGVDFWWVDWQQDYIYKNVYGVPGLKHLPWLNYLYYKHSENSGKRGLGFSRWGGWGDHRNPIQFSGDAGTNWETLAFEVPFTLASGNAGCFFWAHDTGGFWGKRDPEAYTRWVQFGALSSSLRLHSCGAELDRRPWLWGKKFENAMRSFFRLRSELFPYIYTSVRQCHDQTIPLLRPMYISYPKNREAYTHPGQYLFGDNLLVAPIVAPGKGPQFKATKQVWFPEGDWYNYFTGEKIKGPCIKKVAAGISEMPLFIRGGAPITMQPYTSRMSTTPLKTLIIRCYPGKQGASTLYEDDGQSQGYLKGEYARTKIVYENKDGVIKIQISPVEGRYAGQIKQRGYRIELPCTLAAKNNQVNGERVKSTYNKELKMNILKIEPAKINQAVNITVRTE